MSGETCFLCKYLRLHELRCLAARQLPFLGYADWALVPVAGNHPRRHSKGEIQLPVDVDQADQLVAAVLPVTLVPRIPLLRIHRVVVLVEPHFVYPLYQGIQQRVRQTSPARYYEPETDRP